MKKVFTYKGLSNRLLVLGVRPLDAVIIFLGFLFVFGVTNSFIPAIIYLIISYLIARRARFRSGGALSRLLFFLATPSYLPVPKNTERKK